MAIINCPECGEKISDKANKCVHCGCNISVCPECGTPFTDNVKTCPICGYEINKNSVPVYYNNNKTDTTITQDNIVNSWESKGLASVLNRNGKIIENVLLIIAAVFVVIAVIKMYTFKPGSLDELLKIDDGIKGINAFVIFAGIFVFLRLAYDASVELYNSFGICSMIKKYNLDFCPSVKKYITSLKKMGKAGEIQEEELNPLLEELNGLDKICTPAMMLTDVTEKGKVVMQFLVSVISSLLIVVFLCAFGCGYIENYIMSELYSKAFETDYTMLIATAVMVVVKIIIFFVSSRMYNSRQDKWLKMHFADEYKEVTPS